MLAYCAVSFCGVVNMTRKNVIKSTMVTPDADRLIEKMAATLRLHDVQLNGDKWVYVSGFMGAVFENVMKSKDKDAKLLLLLSNHFDLHDKNGEPISEEQLKACIREAFVVIGR
jgi:hypothetical protein